MTNALTSFSVAQLQRALQIKQEIESLENQLAQLLGQPSATPAVRRGRPPGRRGPGRPRGKMSAAGRAAIAAAQRARWARARGEEPVAKPARKRRTMTPAALRALANARAIRWAKVRGGARSAKPGGKVKKHFSAAARAALSAAAKARWAKSKAAGKSTL